MKFYYHYKHSEKKGFQDYAYVYLGDAIHTEEDYLLAIYYPLYKTKSDTHNCLNARPSGMFFEKVNKESVAYKGNRFNEILDKELIKKLKQTEQFLSLTKLLQ